MTDAVYLKSVAVSHPSICKKKQVNLTKSFKIGLIVVVSLVDEFICLRDFNF